MYNFQIGENGTLVKLQEDNRRRIFLKGNLLMFKPTVKEDEGYYKCIARNEAGVNESAVGLYTVFGKLIKTSSYDGLCIT